VAPQNDKEQVQATQRVHKSRMPGLSGNYILCGGAQNCQHNQNDFPYMQKRGGERCRTWFGHCATRHEASGSIPGRVLGYFQVVSSTSYPASRADICAVLVVPNVKLRMEAQHRIPPLRRHDILRGSFTFTFCTKIMVHHTVPASLYPVRAQKLKSSSYFF